MFADVQGPSFVFWPVECGDSTTIVVSASEVIQVDLNDCIIAGECLRRPKIEPLVGIAPTEN